jgi:hypothetical protein
MRIPCFDIYAKGINIFMINKYETDYSGPDPRLINPTYPAHTYETVVCLLDGSCKRIIQERYLKKFGYTKKTYLKEFPGAPLKSASAVESYRRAAFNDGGRRSRNLTNLNLNNSDFQNKRQQACENFYKSDRSSELRRAASERAKRQHSEGLSDHVREYFATRYPGSKNQQARSERMRGENNIIHMPGVVEKGKQTYLQNYKNGYHATSKKNFKHYNLRYQSSYEYHFLEYCESKGLLHLISGAVPLRDELYPRRYYLPDYVFDGVYIVEIKSWFIESKQLSINPNVTNEKKELVARLGYKWLYILDKNYEEFDLLASTRQKVDI